MVEKATIQPVSLRDRILNDSRFAPYLPSIKKPSLADRILADPAFQDLLDQLSAPPAKPSINTAAATLSTTPIQIPEPVPVIPAATETVQGPSTIEVLRQRIAQVSSQLNIAPAALRQKLGAQLNSLTTQLDSQVKQIVESQARAEIQISTGIIEDIQTVQSKLSELKTRLSKVPVSDTAMWQRLSSRISHLASQEAQMLGEPKILLPPIPSKRGALTAAGLGTAGALIGAYPAISTGAAQAFSTARAAIVQLGALPAYGITEADSPQEARNILPSIIVDQAPLIKFATVDSNSPVHWDEKTKTMYVFNSTKAGIRRLSGPDLAHLGRETPVSFDNKINGARWMEATYKDPTTGVLYGWYHNEPDDPSLPKRPQPLTVPRIGAAVSKDNGRTWHDLGFVIDTPQNSNNPETVNLFFAGGNGDFSVIPDPNKEYFYFFISNYHKDPTQQGVAVARMRAEDLNNPPGKILKWNNGKWEEAGLGGRVTPIFKTKGDVHKPQADFFWGPSVHWNNYLKQYVMLLNYSKNAALEQGGIYISFNQDLSNPKGWTTPQKIKKAGSSTSWYPQIVGLDGGSDREAGRWARLFETGESSLVIEFVKPSEKNNIRTYGSLLTTKPTFFRPGTNEQVNPLAGERQIEVLRPAGRGRFLVQTSTGQLEILMEQLDVQGKLSWEKEVKPIEWLGFEFPSAEDMYRVTEIGAGFVRIPIDQADQNFFKENPEVIPAIKAAKARNLEILLLFNPTQTLSLPELKKRIDGMLNLAGNYPKVVFELGNEPDLDIFWEKGDLDSYAKFVKTASSYLWEKQPDAKIVIAAASKREKIQPLINKLKQHGVDLDKFTFGVHAYNDPNEVTKRADLVKATLGPNAKFIFDELGVNISDAAKDKLITQMVNNAINSGAQRVCIFQLYNFQFIDGNGLWGYISPDGKYLPPVKRLMNLAWEAAQKKPPE